MKAFVVEQYGNDGLRAADVPEPKVGGGDVLVKVSAASINPLDKMVRNGEFKRLLKYQTPFVLGHDGAGVVTGVGSAARRPTSKPLREGALRGSAHAARKASQHAVPALTNARSHQLDESACSRN